MADNPYLGAHVAGAERLESVYRTAYDPDGRGGLLNSPRRIVGPRPGHERQPELGIDAGRTLERAGRRADRMGDAQYRRFANPGVANMRRATEAAGGIGDVGVAAQYMGNYMNPFLEEVVGNTRRDLREERDRDLVGITGSAAAGAGAFGGSRHGVREAVGDEMFYRTLADASGRLRSQGFNTALDAAEGDRDFLLRQAIGETDAYSGLGGDYLDAAATLPRARAGLEMDTGRAVAEGLGVRADAIGARANRNLSYRQALADEPFERLTNAADFFRGGTPGQTEWFDPSEEGSDVMDLLLAGARNPEATGDLIDRILGG